MFLNTFFKASILTLSLTIITISALLSTAHAATWTASVNNPNRSAIRTEYISRVDGVVLRILAKGKDLQASVYPAYISNVSKGITALGAKPEYSSNPEITSIIKYISFELDGVSRSLASNDSFFEELMQVIDGASISNVGTSTATTGTVSTGGANTSTTSTTTGAPTPATPPTSTTFELSKTQASIGEEITFNYTVTDDRTCTISIPARTSTYYRDLMYNIPAGTSGQGKYTLLQQDVLNGVIVLTMKCSNGSTKDRSITVQGGASTGTTGTTTTGTLPTTPFYMVVNTDTEGRNVLNFKIDKSYGYKGCMMTVGDAVGITLSPGTTSYSVGNGNTMGLGSSLKADGNWLGSVLVGDMSGFVNLYCQKGDLTRNTQGQLVLNVQSMERLIPATKVDTLFNAPLTNMTITAIPGSTIATTSIPADFDYAGMVRPYVAEVIGRLGQTDAAYQEIIQSARQVVAQGYDLERILPEIAYGVVGRTPTAQEINSVRAYYYR